MTITNPRIFFTGTGGQGTLTATRLLAQAALDAGIDVVAGEVHGMAQRGGVVESALLLGGWRSPRIAYGEADILLGFEALETLRAIPYLKPDGVVFSSMLMLPPPGVALGQSHYPPLENIKKEIAQVARANYFLPTHELGIQTGNPKSGNTALLGALCASGLLPLGFAVLVEAIHSHLPAKIQPANLRAARLGATWMNKMYLITDSG